MENQVVIERLNRTINGQIEGCNVTISYEIIEQGKKPVQIVANGSVPEPQVNVPNPAMAGMITPTRQTVITVSIDGTGEKSSTARGPKSSSELTSLITAIEVEVQSIWDSL